ncbi:protein phosphatase 2C domain-containing protein [Streptomyces sp. 135]|uniref:protein phosphatase 2C domain-containing protein n=1 Tax=Streptomyces sp. 135 TaxID=2838850 RepID=UPI001CBC7062|nr:protein phosphatase 2C domain-containing protein [Streptomyces sp. 135]
MSSSAGRPAPSDPSGSSGSSFPAGGSTPSVGSSGSPVPADGSPPPGPSDPPVSVFPAGRSAPSGPPAPAAPTGRSAPSGLSFPAGRSAPSDLPGAADSPRRAYRSAPSGSPGSSEPPRPSARYRPPTSPAAAGSSGPGPGGTPDPPAGEGRSASATPPGHNSSAAPGAAALPSPRRPAAARSAPLRPAPWEPPRGPSGPVTFGAGGSGEASGASGGATPKAVPGHVGDGPPTYEAEPTALPAADPDDLGELVADTVLDGARYGTATLRAASVRGDSARYRGEPRRDSLLTARFGVGEDALVLVAMATGARATPGAHRAAAEACAWIGRAVGRSHQRLAEDIRAARRGDLKSGLHRLTDRSLGKLRARATDLGLAPHEYAASLRCLLLPADPQCRTRVFFGVGAGGLFRLRDGAWQDIEPRVAEATGDAVVGFGSPPARTPEGDHLTMDLGITTPPSPYEPAPEPPRDPFRFRASVARPGDTLLLCSGGLAEPLRGEPALAEHLTDRWLKGPAPGLAAFLADIQVRVKGYADDRTAAAVWEA